MESSGFGLFLTAVAGCSRAPVENAFGYIEQPEGVVQGKAEWYASVCGGCPAACGILVKNRDGRPIKLEGNPQHPLSEGGLCAAGQASVLGLYDSDRLKGPMIGGKPSTWKKVDAELQARLKDIRAKGGAVRFLSESVVSPTQRAMIQRFLSGGSGSTATDESSAGKEATWGGFADARHVIYDPLSSSAILDAHEQTHGVRVLPSYQLDKAHVIVSLDADFLGTWIAPVTFTTQYQRHRVPEGDPADMSYHAQFEARKSLTGANADERFIVTPDQLGPVLSHLAIRLAKQAGITLENAELGEPPIAAEHLDRVAERLWQARGKSVVLCGSQDVQVQVLANFVNHLLQAYGTLVLIDQPSLAKQGNDRELHALLEEIRTGKVAALFIAGVNPIYDLPGTGDLADQFKRIPLVVSFADHLDETAAHAHYVCPQSHFLESWGDAEPVSGLISIVQPALLPLGSTRTVSECLAAWMNEPQDALELVQQHWKQEVYPSRNAEQESSQDQSFQSFWDTTLLTGFTRAKPAASAAKEFDQQPVQLSKGASEQPADALSLVLYPTVALADGRHALNPWLQELPDPVTKVTWDNYASLSPATAARLGVTDGDVIRIGNKADGDASPGLELPVLVQQGQHDRVVAVALGYGRKGSERFATIGPDWFEARPLLGTNGLVGTNAAPWLSWTNKQLNYGRGDVVLTKVGTRHELACTQHHHSVSVPEDLALPGAHHRPMIQDTTLPAFRKDPYAGAEHQHDHGLGIWRDDHPYTGHRWGMAIDLARCTGCSACVIACQAENNVPVVGRDEVRRSREMHWIRIDRYYLDDGNPSDTAHQPMLCHHCENAPCENVCPVLATVHSDEGLNQQVYNRCVGTRYCANNCPYKVRRFNWFEYARENEQENLVLNPDVTVRSRGVMEKCSFCAQRIQEAKLEAQTSGRELADGDIKPACQQSCPAQAIVFGDLNDPESQVSKLSKSPRYYQVLGELNIRPAVGYLRRVRNREEGEVSEGGTQHG